MASSKTDICNLALGHLALDSTIENVETERSLNARMCRRFYDQSLEEVLRDGYWSFANRYAALALIEEDPDDRWAYSYRYPTEALKLHEVGIGIRQRSQVTTVPYKIASDDDGKIILCDQPDVYAEYTTLVETVEHYPADFVQALALHLAAAIAPGVTGGDPGKLGTRAMQLYAWRVASAQANDFNEQQDTAPQRESSFIDFRE
jgi:hypothetical protein